MTNMNESCNPKFVFVVAEKKGYQAGPGTEHQVQWLNFLGNVKNNIKMPEGTQTIHENIWLIPLAPGLLLVPQLIPWATQYGISIHVLLLAEALNWIKYPLNATSNA